jgi:hypothetical protein
MAGFVIERHGYATGAELAAEVIVDMLANGFTLVDQSNGQPTFNKASAGENFCVIMEAGPTVDPLNGSAITTKQPWRVCVDIQGAHQVLIHTGSPTTLYDVEKLPIYKELAAGDPTKGAGWKPVDVIGTTGAKLTNATLDPITKPSTDPTTKPSPTVSKGATIAGYEANEGLEEDGTYIPKGIVTGYRVAGDENPNAGGYMQEDFLDNENLRWVPDATVSITGATVTDDNSKDNVLKCFINRTKRIGSANPFGYPMSYRLVITNRGFWLGVWEESTTQEGSMYFNWVLVQRPVDRTTGETVIDGKAPVFCVNAVGNKFWRFVVRESDIMRPSSRIDASVDSEDAEAILNIENQVSLSEDGKYIITFPSRLNSSRYRYPHELDMMATTSADVVSQNTSVELTVYGESAARTYRALHANGPANTGMRVMILEQGGGID